MQARCKPKENDVLRARASTFVWPLWLKPKGAHDRVLCVGACAARLLRRALEATCVDGSRGAARAGPGRHERAARTRWRACCAARCRTRAGSPRPPAPWPRCTAPAGRPRTVQGAARDRAGVRTRPCGTRFQPSSLRGRGGGKRAGTRARAAQGTSACRRGPAPRALVAAAPRASHDGQGQQPASRGGEARALTLSGSPRCALWMASCLTES